MRAGILRILQISRAEGTPLPMAGRLTQLAKIFSVIYTTALRRFPLCATSFYNRTSAVFLGDSLFRWEKYLSLP